MANTFWTWALVISCAFAVVSWACALIALALRRRRWRRQISRWRATPLDQWVQVDETTRVMRHADGSTSFSSRLDHDHPRATWTLPD